MFVCSVFPGSESFLEVSWKSVCSVFPGSKDKWGQSVRGAKGTVVLLKIFLFQTVGVFPGFCMCLILLVEHEQKRHVILLT